MESSGRNFILNFFLVLLLLLPIVTRPCLAAPNGGGSIEFIKTSCATTSYPTLCYTSLSTHASAIQRSPKILAHTALSVALTTAKTTSASMLKLSNTPGLKPREIGAVKDCIQEMGEAVEKMQKSLGEMGSYREADFQMMINDVQTWVSAALTYEDTCTDGFSGKMMNGNMKTVVRGNILKIVQLTSNALALINSYAAVHG